MPPWHAPRLRMPPLRPFPDSSGRRANWDTTAVRFLEECIPQCLRQAEGAAPPALHGQGAGRPIHRTGLVPHRSPDGGSHCSPEPPGLFLRVSEGRRPPPRVHSFTTTRADPFGGTASRRSYGGPFCLSASTPARQQNLVTWTNSRPDRYRDPPPPGCAEWQYSPGWPTGGWTESSLLRHQSLQSRRPGPSYLAPPRGTLFFNPAPDGACTATPCGLRSFRMHHCVWWHNLSQAGHGTAPRHLIQSHSVVHRSAVSHTWPSAHWSSAHWSPQTDSRTRSPKNGLQKTVSHIQWPPMAHDLPRVCPMDYSMVGPTKAARRICLRGYPPPAVHRMDGVPHGTAGGRRPTRQFPLIACPHRVAGHAFTTLPPCTAPQP